MVFCWNCGRELSEGSDTCPYCRAVRLEKLGTADEIRRDPTKSLMETSLGAKPGETNLYVKKAVPWKGKKVGKDTQQLAKYASTEAKGKRLVEGVEKMIGLSKEATGIRGKMVDPITGRVIPQKGFYQRLRAGGLSPEDAKKELERIVRNQPRP